jgi:pimeloyl-ACP methyl ester carboxylesterase
VDPYSSFLLRLRRHTDLLVFPYDWRLSNDVSARDLEAAIKARWWPSQQQQRAISPESRVIIIAHSMGGLIARAFIEGRNGYRYVKRLITVGTPHLGAPDAFTSYYGWTQKLPSTIMSGRLQEELTRSFASAIQLLPLYRFVTYRGVRESPSDTYRRRRMTHTLTGRLVDLVRRLLWGTLKPPSRLNAWLCGLGAYRVHYHSLASTGTRTVSGFNEDTRRIRYTMSGDGTVPLLSALLPGGTSTLAMPPGMCIGRWQFRNVQHMRLLEDNFVQDWCLGLIPVSPRERELEVGTIERGTGIYETELEREIAIHQ